MNITINAPKAYIANGASFFELFQGIETYAELRTGEDVTITTNEGDVEGTIAAVSIGPLGAFLGQGISHTTTINRGYDVRSIVDALEKRYPTNKTANKKALDPRTIYTQVVIAVPYVAPSPVIPAA